MSGRAIHRHVLVDVDEALVDAAVDAVAGAMDRLDVAADAEVAVVIADDVYLHRLNLAYRGYDKPTDVLSFRAGGDADRWPGGGAVDADADAGADVAGGAADAGDGTELGDIVISLPYAARSAAARSAPVVDELRLLAVHGLLHLLGHDDADEAGAAGMRAEEVRLGVRVEGDEGDVGPGFREVS